jgi:hypothetical protein
MHMMAKRLALPTTLAVAVLTLTTTAGCRRGVTRLPVTPVAGKVLFQGKPVAGARVLLIPLNRGDQDVALPRGTTGSDGMFKLTTYAPEDGAPAGEYTVSLTWKGPQQGAADTKGDGDRPLVGGVQLDYFKNRYKDPKTSGLRLKIEPGAAELSPINLK